MTTYTHDLHRYHGEGDPEHQIVELEMQEMNEAISTTGTDKQVSLSFHLLYSPNTDTLL